MFWEGGYRTQVSRSSSEVLKGIVDMDIFVYADWIGLNSPSKMGTLSVTHVKGHEVFSFAYDEQWLGGGKAQNLDPDLQFYSGSQYLAPGKKNYGMFLDS